MISQVLETYFNGSTNCRFCVGPFSWVLNRGSEYNVMPCAVLSGYLSLHISLRFKEFILKLIPNIFTF